MLDRRCKHKIRHTQDFYFFIRDRRNHIFYVRFRDGKTVSTGCTDADSALKFALAYGAEIQKAPQKDSRFHDILLRYYDKDSSWQKYDTAHGTVLPDHDRKTAKSRMEKISSYLSDVKSADALTRKRLIELQETLKDAGLSAKTINNYFTDFHRIIKQLYDKEMLKADPFTGLKKVQGEKLQRICFPVQLLKGSFDDSKLSLLAYIAIVTGARRGEFFRWDLNGSMLSIHGTKTAYSERTVPLSPEAVRKLKLLKNEKITAKDFPRAVEYMKEKLNYNEDGIVFHSFRKLFKTILTSANLNTTLVEMLMGHTTNNQQSNDVERIYFVAEKADLRSVYEHVTKVFSDTLD
jgi:integrase